MIEAALLGIVVLLGALLSAAWNILRNQRDILDELRRR